jgi:hypothetical protein
MARPLFPSLIAAALVVAAPAVRAEDVLIRAEWLGGEVRIVLAGSHVGSRYTVERSAGPRSAGVVVGERDALCTGDCYVLDPGVLLGGTYWYRFDVTGPDGVTRAFGPLPVTIGDRAANGLSASLSPNPLRDRGTVRITAGLAAGARAGDAGRATDLPGEVTLMDPSGRVLRTLWSGTLDRLTFDVPFVARDARGERLPTGLYFIVLRAGTHRTLSRIVVVR